MDPSFPPDRNPRRTGNQVDRSTTVEREHGGRPRAESKPPNMNTLTTTFPLPPQRRWLCDAIGEAVSVSWADVMPQSDEGLIHVEYEAGSERFLNWLKVWSSTNRGHWSLVCEYWMDEHSFGETGPQFADGYHSDGLGESLKLIMQHQRKFVPPESGLLGLIQVYPPSGSQA
jgi:hypothetical protein